MSFPHRNHAEIPGMVGIDLGTYNSAAAAAVGSRSVMLRAREGATDQGICFPSVVEFDGQGEPVQVGELARQSMPVYPERVVCGVKRLIGRPYRRAAETGDTTRFGYQTLPGPDGSCQIQVGPKIYSPTDITSLILQKIKQDAQADFNPLGREIQEAVITVPAYFDPFQKSETERAALDAGFQRVHLMPEPTAAASAYRLEVEQEDQYIVVIDLGAGTLDVTVALLFLDENGQLQTDEKGHGGDTTLGGLDMDDAIIRHVVQEHRLARVLSGPQMKARLRFELEKAKIALSTQTSTQVAFAAGVQDVRFQFHRVELEAAVAPVVARCRGPIRVALEEAGLSPCDVCHVLLVGGPTMMPVVRRMVLDEFGSNSQVVQELKAIDEHGFPVHPMEAVARGAVLGSVGRITPHGYGILLSDVYHELLPRRQRYPCEGRFGFSRVGHYRSVNFGLVRQAVDPATHREEYLLLGTFAFDYCAQPDRTQLAIDWEYTENGLLNFHFRQQSTSVHLPLFDVSRLEGQKIRKPTRSIEMLDSRRDVAQRPPSPPPATWSHHELEQAIQLGRELLNLAQERGQQANPAQVEKIRRVSRELTTWIDDSTRELGVRVPQIRDLNRALLNVLLVNRLVNEAEVIHAKQVLQQ